MQFSFAGRKVPAETATVEVAPAETPTAHPKGSARRSLIVMMVAFVLAMIASRAPDGGFRGAVWFLNDIRGFLDTTIIGAIGRPATTGLFFVFGLAGGAALWPWRRDGARAEAVADEAAPVAEPESLIVTQEQALDDGPVGETALAETVACVAGEEIADGAGSAPVVEPSAAMLCEAVPEAMGEPEVAETEAAEPGVSSRALALRARALGSSHAEASETPPAPAQQAGDAGSDAFVAPTGGFDDGGNPALLDAGSVAVADPAVAASRRKGIVFRELFPPPADPGLSFYGGAPVVPPGFEWPLGNEGAPLHFLLQVDCRSIPAEGCAGLLPDNAVLYFFLDLEWGGPAGYRVISHAGPDSSWTEAAVPPGLSRLYGEEACHAWPWLDPLGTTEDEAVLAELPRLLPRWPFEPVAIDIPEIAGSDPVAECWWSDSEAVKAELLRAQGQAVIVPQRQPVEESGGLARPYPEFPHDWRAIAIASAVVLEKVRTPTFHATCQRSGLDAGQVEARREQWLGEAAECLAWAHSHGQLKRVPRVEADMFWGWLSGLEGIAPLVVREAAVLAVEATLPDAPGAVMRLGHEALAPVHARHALAVCNDDHVFADVPNRMLSSPSHAQGALDEAGQAEILLLEISASDPIGQRFGEGVYQFTIAPEDLRSRRFDKVRLTIGVAGS